MIEGETAGRLDFQSLRDAIERHDPDALLGFYRDEAELRVVNSGAPEGSAFELRGKAEIERYLRAVSGQGVTSRIEDETVGEGRISFSERCEYPDGSRILVGTTLELVDGRISRQLDVVEHS